MITGKNYIGNLRSSLGTTTFKTFNPEENIQNSTIFYEASELEIDKALQLATAAFKEFQFISGEKKSKFLLEIANEIENLGDELISTYCKESGLTEARAVNEKNRTLHQLKSFAKFVAEGSWIEATIETAIPYRKPTPKPDLRKMLVPLGPVVVFGASNFPLAYSTAGGDTASALAAGCPVIVKSHPMHAGTGELVASAIIEAAQNTGMPNGVFSNLNSSGIEVGKKLAEHPQVKAIGFTGSITGGRALYNIANKREEPIPVFAEMGSINPVVIFPEELKNNMHKWVDNYTTSITQGAGQFCTNPGLILGIKSKELSDFINKLALKIVEVEPSCMLHPNIVSAYEKNKGKILNDEAVAKVVSNSQKVPANYGKPLITTVNGNTFLENISLHTEVFGPFSLIVQCENFEQLEAIISNIEGQLTGTIIASENEIKKHLNIVNALKNRVGRLIFNGVPTGVEVCDAMVHGGPYPASTDSRFTAVGIHSIKRWVRPVAYQNWPNNLLPEALKNENPLEISRAVNGIKTSSKIEI